MERLTYRDANGELWYSDAGTERDRLHRLAAYEEIGLEPGEIEQLKGEAFGLRVDKQELEQYRALGPIDRLRELAQADKEGISPCTFCRFNPPSSGDGKPCCMCPAEAALRREQDKKVGSSDGRGNYRVSAD